ncbi:DUF6660 family protein [Sphingobacterium suaedae]|uniref:DUF6660 family protein n=1 Tax=Sphingobacterium suaedae TaxID=1686402 RepID=A0ABW5KF26_9SPHI
MRWLTTILAVYLLGLLLIPCSDMDTRFADQHIEPTSQQKHEHEHTRNDGCSPLCCCSCCSATITSVDVLHPTLDAPLSILLSVTQGIETLSIIPEYPSSIWQPPKINA